MKNLKGATTKNLGNILIKDIKMCPIDDHSCMGVQNYNVRIPKTYRNNINVKCNLKLTSSGYRCKI